MQSLCGFLSKTQYNQWEVDFSRFVTERTVFFGEANRSYPYPMHGLAVSVVAFLSFVSLNGVQREARAVSFQCDGGIVAYRVVAKEGTPITYAGTTYRVDRSGAIELLVDDAAEVIRVGAKTYPLPMFGQPDQFGVVTVRLPAR
jgi:hypothetical protein